MKIYFAWLRNMTSREDDEPIKIKAQTLEDARKVAANNLHGRFLIRDVYTRSQFKKLYPWWHATLWGTRAVNE